MKYRFFFDYIHFRINKRVYKRDSDGFSGFIALALSQSFFLGTLGMIILQQFYNHSTLVQQSKSYGKFIGVVFFILLFLNYKKHNKKYWKYWEYWKDESRSLRQIKGWLVLIALIAPFLFFILVANQTGP